MIDHYMHSSPALIAAPAVCMPAQAQPELMKSNQMLFVTCAEYNLSEMLTYKPLTNNAVLRKISVK